MVSSTCEQNGDLGAIAVLYGISKSESAIAMKLCREMEKLLFYEARQFLKAKMTHATRQV